MIALSLEMGNIPFPQQERLPSPCALAGAGSRPAQPPRGARLGLEAGTDRAHLGSKRACWAARNVNVTCGAVCRAARIRNVT